MPKRVRVNLTVSQWEAVANCLGAVIASGMESDVCEAQGSISEQHTFINRAKVALHEINRQLEPKGTVEDDNDADNADDPDYGIPPGF